MDRHQYLHLCLFNVKPHAKLQTEIQRFLFEDVFHVAAIVEIISRTRFNIDTQLRESHYIVSPQHL